MISQQPGHYLRLRARHPAFFAAVETLGEAVHHSGPLDAKTLHLVQLSAAAAIRSEGAVHSHVRRALSAGATVEDVRHALIATTSTIGFPNVLAALSWSDDVLEKTETDVPPV